MKQETPITLDPVKHMCPRHLEPFRMEWPMGVLPAMMTMFEAFVRDPDVITYAHQDMSKIPLALTEFGPMCCRVFPGLVDEITEAALNQNPDALRAVVAKIRKV